jgi:hypothetical protein
LKHLLLLLLGWLNCSQVACRSILLLLLLLAMLL